MNTLKFASVSTCSVQEDECGRMYAAVIDLEFAVDAGVVEADTAAGVVDAEREGELRIRPVFGSTEM